MHTRRGFAEATGLAIAVIAAGVTYAILAVHPWAHTPLNQFLATFGRANAAVWPMQIIWYLAAVAMVGLAFQRAGRSSQLICALAAAYSAWVAIAYFAWQMPGMNLSWLWAAVFTLQAVLLLMAGTVRSDLVIRPRKDVTSALGAVFIGYALIGYPVLGLLGGHPLHNLPVLGLSPCATVVFFSGLLLWARPPVPKYLLPLPLAWALVAAPPDLAMGVTADYGMLIAAVLTVGLIIWRDRTTTPAWQTVTGGLLLALMIAWSGHDDVMIGTALILVVLTLAQAIRSHPRPPGTVPATPDSKAKVNVG